MGCKCMTSYYIININKYFCPNRLFVSPSYTGVSCILVTFFFLSFLMYLFLLIKFQFCVIRKFTNKQANTHTHTHSYTYTERHPHTQYFWLCMFTLPPHRLNFLIFPYSLFFFFFLPFLLFLTEQNRTERERKRKNK